MLTTESQNPASLNLDQMSALDIVKTMNAEDAGVAQSVARVLPEVAQAVDAITERMQRGGRLIIVNQGETHLDHYADVTLHADAAVALPAIIEQLQIADRTLQIG